MVCGLAWRCRMSRSVKNDCRVGVSVLIAGPPDVLGAAARRPPSAPATPTVPVGAGRMDVPEISRNQCQAGLPVLPGGVGVEHGTDRETVPEVVVVPTSAQPRLCRRLRYADLGE